MPLRQSDFRHLSFCPTTDIYLPPMRAASIAHKFRGILDYSKIVPREAENEVKDDSAANRKQYSVQKLIGYYLGN